MLQKGSAYALELKSFSSAATKITITVPLGGARNSSLLRLGFACGSTCTSWNSTVAAGGVISSSAYSTVTTATTPYPFAASFACYAPQTQACAYVQCISSLAPACNVAYSVVNATAAAPPTATPWRPTTRQVLASGAALLGLLGLLGLLFSFCCCPQRLRACLACKVRAAFASSSAGGAGGKAAAEQGPLVAVANPMDVAAAYPAAAASAAAAAPALPPGWTMQTDGIDTWFMHEDGTASWEVPTVRATGV